MSTGYLLIQKKVVISVDFGTSRSGFSVIFLDDKKKSTHKELQWEASESRYCKNLTQILYDKTTKKPVTWGYAALRTMAEQFDTDSDSTEGQYHLFKYFKLGLQKDCKQVEDESGQIKKPVMDVIHDYLSFLFDKIKDFYNRATNRKLNVAEITWCFTIPAIWDDKEKEAMRVAAKKVGMIGRNASDDDFKIVLEPEAAAVYCLEYMKNNSNKSLRNGDTFVVVDAGGGTIDLTTYVVESGRIKEQTRGSGDKLGSSFLDDAFWALLEQRFGKDLMNNFKKDAPFDHHLLMCEWEKEKCKVKNYVKQLQVRVPGVLGGLLLSCNVDRKLFNKVNYTIILSGEDIKEIFSPIVHGILDLISKQLEEMQVSNGGTKADFIFIVGGFGGSEVLHDQICNAFATRLNNGIEGVIRPSAPSEAIIDGAALLGLDDSLIKSRRMRRSYGVKSIQKFDPQKHDTKNKKRYRHRDGEWSENCFETFVVAGQEVEFNQVITKEFNAYTATQKCMQVEIYTSLFCDLVYINEKETEKVGTLIIRMDDLTGGIDRVVQLRMYFGRANVKIEAYELTTNKKYDASIRYESDLFEYDGVQPIVENLTAEVRSFGSRYAGRSLIPDANEFDKFNNPMGAKYDLAEDGAFKGFKVIIGEFYPSEIQKNAGPMLTKKGFEWYATNNEVEFVNKLNDYDIAWVISYFKKESTCAVADALVQFSKQGKGVLVWADNVPYFAHANGFLSSIFGLQLIGNTLGCKVLSLSDNPRETGTFLKNHYITTGVGHLYEGETICYPDKSHLELNILATSTDGNPVVLYSEKTNTRGRIVVDCGFTKLFCNWDTAGTGRYIANATCWITGVEFE